MVYVAFDPKDEEVKDSLEACIYDIHQWMKWNFLKLNDTKTEFLIMGSSNQLQIRANDTIRIGDENNSASASAHSIGAIFDRTVSLKEQVHSICRSCYCHIRNIGRVRRSLTKEASISRVHVFISSTVDHLNVLLYGIPKYLFQKVQ